MDADEAQAREYLAALVRGPEPTRSAPPVLAVPERPAAEVIAVARRLALGEVSGEATSSGPGPVPLPLPELLGVAAALVVDEHPAAAGWSTADRKLLTRWVAVLIERRGEDGVQDLVRALDEERDHRGEGR
ncbi:hypothetical protein ACPC54_40055 [Kitasatospora sp. NPDC094028]